MSDGVPFEVTGRAEESSHAAPSHAWWPILVIALALALTLAWAGLLALGAVEAVLWLLR
jgi:hypothetical protein